MAITISSLTPPEPIVVTEGDTINFAVSASDDGGATLSYQWQISVDGGTSYSASGLTNNTNTFFNLGPVDSGSNGIFVRVVITNGVDTIYSDQESVGSRSVTVTSAPIILVLVENTQDDYPVSETIDVGDAFDFTVTSSLQNADISTTTNVDNIFIQWQESTDDGASWSNITSGGDYAIVTTTEAFTTGGTTAYYRKSTITVSNSGYSRNLNQYRAVVSYSGASNTPVNMSAILLYVSPVISIFKQPGTDPNDTQEFQCFKTGISGSGNVTVSVGAFSTSGQSLSYQWQLSVEDEAGYPEQSWNDCDDPGNTNSWSLVPGTDDQSPTLQIQRLIFYNVVAFRCNITGSASEPPVTTAVHYVYPTDVETTPTIPSTYEFVEDKYGDIANRDLYPEPIQAGEIVGSINFGRNTGQNGDLQLTLQKQAPGTTTWTDVLVGTQEFTEDYLVVYTGFPGDDTAPVDIVYTTPPLRRDVDNGTKFRVKAESSAVFTSGTGASKTIEPFYSSESTLTVYRTVYITNQPSTATGYVNQSTAFAVGATPSSGDASIITYQWQYSTNGIANNWVDITNGGIYSGATTDLLQISAIPSLTNNVYPFYRCVLSVPDQLASVTTIAVVLYVEEDLFTSITNLNDIYAEETDNISWTVTATSLSAATVTYQWEKSTDFNPTTETGTWTELTGETSATFNIASAALSDIGYYRCKVTSFGGTVKYTNAAQLTVAQLIITILTDITSSLTFLEGIGGSYTFECQGLSSNSSVVEYQWEIQPPGGSFAPAGPGFLQSADNTRFYTPSAFARSDDGSKIRCKMSSSSIPNPTYTTECDLTVNRRFTYFADISPKVVTIGSTLYLDINPQWTGGSPTFQWQLNGSDISGETGSSLVVNNVDSSFNGRVYRCEVTLADCNEYAYTQNNSVTVVSASPVDYTQSVTISTTTAAQKPKYYSIQTMKSGAAIGTVICVPKPSGYVNNAAATTDDLSQWEVSVSGDDSSSSSSSASSVVSSGSVYNSNKPSWVSNSSHKTPKWLQETDRFPGYIEMRGQYLKAQDFPELARIFGTSYGGTITGTYPKYGSNDVFRMPLTYGKKLMGTGNVSGNSGSVSVIPEYAANGSSGGDKLIPGSMGGVYNYIKSAQLPPGSPGVAGLADGTADGSINAETFTIGTFKTEGIDSVEGFVQPTFSGTLTYTLPSSNAANVTNPVHAHSGVTAGGLDNYYAVNNGCNGNNNCLNTCSFPGSFKPVEGSAGEILSGPYGLSDSSAGQQHNHTTTGTVGSFDMVKDAGMIISDTTVRMNLQSKQLFDNSLNFYLRNNENVPVNAPYFRLKYMIKAY